MDPRRRQLFERITRARAQRPCRFSVELKRDIVTYAEARREEGITNRQIARELALADTVLGAWLRHARRMRSAGRQPFEPRYRSEGLAAALPQNLPDKAPLSPAPPAGRKRGSRRARATGTLWLVVRAEHVYMTSTKPTRLVRLLDDSSGGTAGSA